MNNLGYTKQLFVLAFDHQSTFEKEGIENIAELKQVIYEAFKKSLSTIQNAAILIDEKYGEEILKDAKKNNYTVALKVEKSGQEEFVFEYGEDFATHIEKYSPEFAKVVIKVASREQNGVSDLSKTNLRKLSDYCHSHNFKFMLELISNSNVNLILKTIVELQDSLVEPDVWKIEGMDSDLDYLSIVQEVRKNGRDNVSLVILGRGENKETVERWVKIGAKTAGIIGFAIGRTIFWEELMALKSGTIKKEEAIEQISQNYIYFYKLFIE